MTKHAAIRQETTEDEATINAMARAICAAVSAAERLPDGRGVLGAMLAATLDEVCVGAPLPPLYGSVRDEASFWADIATPVELEAYAAAALRRIERTTFAQQARKRLFMEFWRGFSDAERQKFLDHAKKNGG